MTFFTAPLTSLRRGVAHVKAHWETWLATGVTVALTGLELLSDYLPLIAGAVGGWQLVALTSAISFGLAALRTKQKRAKRKPKTKADSDAGANS